MKNSGLVDRSAEVRLVKALLKENPVVGILGARQVGKTTLANQLAGTWRGPVSHFDLESPPDRSRLADAMLGLQDLKGLVVLDEIQRAPDIFAILRVLADRAGPPARFLVLGSASPALLKQSAESLAGRIAYHQLGGFSLSEVGMPDLNKLWRRGSFPRSYLARNEALSVDWRRNFISTFLERDLPQLGSAIPSATLGRFWAMLAHWHGQVWRASEFARSFGVSESSVSRYLELLTSVLVARRLPPWYENMRKRQIRSPKVYLADSGILHALLDIEEASELERHPKLGASWEGFMLEQVIRHLRVRTDQCYFWATQGGAELDLLVKVGTRRFGFEFKRTTTPRVTPSMKSALADLKLKELTVVHAGSESFPMGPRIKAVAASRLLSDISPDSR